MKIGAWIANPALNLLEQGDRSVRLEPRAMDVLVQLARRAGAVTSLEELMKAVWVDVVVSDGSVYLAISQLRQALGETAGGASYIETVPKRGYRLAVPVGPVSVEPAASQPLVTVDAPAPVARRSIRGWGVAVLAIGAISGLIVTAVNLRPTASAAEQSLAVLPFADLSPDSDQAYFADGITEEVLNLLAGVRDLRVIGRTSSFQLRGQGADTRTLGEKLDVGHLLTGSVRKADDRVRITAQLTDAPTGRQLWSQTYERKLDDIFAIQDEIAKAVADAMQVKLGVGELARMPGMTRDVAAYDEYLRGMALNIVGRREAFPQSIAHLQRAIDIDPQFSMAWAGLNAAYSNGAFAVPERAAEWRRSAAESLEHARQLTPDAPHVLLGLGVAATRRQDWLGGAEYFRRLEEVLAEHGLSAESAGPRGALLIGVGRARAAVPALESARAHDPLAPAYASFLSLAYLTIGDTRAALGEIDRGLKLDGLRDTLLNNGVSIALATHDRAEIERRLAAITDDVPMARVNRRMAEFLDNPAGAPAAIRELVATSTDVEKTSLAVWAAYYEDPAMALELLADVLPRRSHPGVIWHPVLADMRSLPGFEALVTELGMADYWRVHGFADLCEPAGERIRCR